MLIRFSDASNGAGYDPYPDFKAMVEKLCANGVEVFFSQSGGDITRIYAFGAGCCRGEFPVAIQTGLMIESASAQSDFATDFPNATQIDHYSGGSSPVIEV